VIGFNYTFKDADVQITLSAGESPYYHLISAVRELWQADRRRHVECCHWLFDYQPLLKSEWAVWRVEGGREPGAANP